MYIVLRGVYENGVLSLLEPAPHVNHSHVLVTFLSEADRTPTTDRKPGGLIRLANFKDKKLSIPEDFNDPLDDLKDYI